ncbi:MULTISPECIES: SDR family NAD(P)-dependent oxidoreductase [unclassified Novosphingobium]|uniref:SDR family oxidoreductase n=1 Tax=unclassified Novosphingobium TaxID=2644732 RepID=UPI000966FD67|nr:MULTISPECIES: SDR family NAD(P)-dependent oxidoreductase [unclassified Novosphingobium]MBN9144957.1 SDR family NAD(P)-dependent oxidoreductase [Novosphingobium sp.]MDR6708878.1 NAD(P)-dependent dehydrogenase (short-subunit alcohol dehydrogenase family) [Novosphingobium sp. 1748]NKJ01989.1 NAD(P)-dependent dehydrogenase (short-subunit alcohol dehydrogenase family) [Novosphingobium sp. SG707]OJX90014.1 MAG: short-chain dehydrogenase [Novosphingobium sp. 63-713]
MGEETKDWAGRVAFISGGVSGLGFGIARAFALAGMRLALSWRNEDYRSKAAAWFAQNGLEEPLWVRLDVTDREGFARAAAQVEEHFGAVHVVVNNAGVSVFGNTAEASYDDYDWIMGVNFGGVVNGVVSFLPALRRATGRRHVVNIASMAAYLSGPQAGIYTASKFAVRGLTESLRYNLVPLGIGCSLVCPALVATNAWDSAFRRPAEFADSGFGEVNRGALEHFGKVFSAGMDPLEAGQRILSGMSEGKGLIFTHPEFAEDFKAIYEDSLAALPSDEAPPERLEVERMRRAANKAALEGREITIADLN